MKIKIMKIFNFGDVPTGKNPSDIEGIMSKRFENDMNEVLLAHDDHDYPYLGIALKGDLAALYPGGDGEAGFVSIGGKLELPPDGMTTFATGDPNEEISISNRAIITSSEALAAAKEFFCSERLPKSIEWLEL
jgi:hypothetical protein